MDDSFSFGRPQKHRSKVRTRPRRRSEPDPPPKHAASRRTVSIDGRRLAFGVTGAVLLAVSAWGFLHLEGSSEVSGDQGVTAQPGDAAGDLEAKQTAANAAQTVQSLYASDGSFEAVTPRALRTADGSSAYAAAASGSTDAVSVASTPTGVGLAVRSESGTCFYTYVIASGVTYGTGSPCTGEAALGASAPAWPSEST